MTIEGTTVLITGANRGIGRALVEEALSRRAKRVYAGSRQPITHPDERVTPVVLDVTDTDQIRSVANQVQSLDVLVNNAGIALYDNLSDRSILEQHLAVNLFGPYEVIQAFLPRLTQSRGVIVNNLSMMAMAPLPMTPAYALSKAAAFNLTQSLRAILVGRGIQRPRRPDRPDRHRHDPRLRDPQSHATVGGPVHLRRRRRRRGGHLPGRHLAGPRRQLALQRGQGPRARVRRLRQGRVRRRSR